MKIRVVAGVALGAALLAPAPATAATAPELSGAAVYADGHRLARYEGGKWSTLAEIGALPQFAVSPDGRKAAWVTDGGNLQVKDGAKTVTAATKLQGGTPCLTPVWSPDSTQIAYVGKGETVMAVKADGTGRRRLGTSKGVCHLAWAAGGRYLAGYTGEADAVYRLDVRTGKAARAKGVKLVTHVQSLSPNGRNAVVAVPADPAALGDGSWPSAFKPAVVDLVSGRTLTPAVKGRLIGAFYLADGRLVVRVAGAAHNTLVVLDAAGKESRRIEEPARARTQALLQVLP